MKRSIRTAVAGALFIFGAVVQSHAQHLVQTLGVNLTAYDTVSNRIIIIRTTQLIKYLAGTNVPYGHLFLVTPTGNAPGSLDGLGAFLRITSGTRTVLEIPSPSQFNVYQDVAALRTNRLSYTSHALNRFSFDTGSVRAELQGFSSWVIPRRVVGGVDLSGAGSFLSRVNGWIGIYKVTQPLVPISGYIFAGYPRPGL